jgi:hypothetical protein
MLFLFPSNKNVDIKFSAHDAKYTQEPKQDMFNKKHVNTPNITF